MSHMNELVDPSLARELERAGTDRKVDVLFAYMERRGQTFYDEAVTQLQHALQCANQARLSVADGVLVTGALLHDLGHFLVDEKNEKADFLTEDLCHEEVGARYLEPFFIDAVTEPVGAARAGQALHLHRRSATTTTPCRGPPGGASRCRAASCPTPRRPPSRPTPTGRSAVQLRKWDDLAKVEGLETPGLESYREAVQGMSEVNGRDRVPRPPGAAPTPAPGRSGPAPA